MKSDVEAKIVPVNIEGAPEFQWTCIMREMSNKHINRLQFAVFLSMTIVLAYALFIVWERFQNDIAYICVGAAVVYVGSIPFIMAIRQKTVYNYKVFSSGGVCERYLYASELFKLFSKSFVAIGLVVVFVASVFMGSLVPLAGGGAMVVIYGLRLLNEENKVTTENSLPWKEYGYITLDYKRNMVVAHKTNIDLGFEFRFSDRGSMEPFLAFLNTVLRPDVQYLERDWDAENFRINWEKEYKKNKKREKQERRNKRKSENKGV